MKEETESKIRKIFINETTIFITVIMAVVSITIGVVNYVNSPVNELKPYFV